MIAGPLDRRVTLRRATVQTNDLGEDIETWADYATVWAARAEVSNRERFAAQQVGAELVARYRIRYSQRVAELSPRDRIVAGGTEHNITGVAMIGRREGWEITAAARSDGAEASAQAAVTDTMHVSAGNVVTTGPTVRTNHD